ncbi:MAG: flagellar biosynthetic protein FliR, partial [Bacilli bacterium]
DAHHLILSSILYSFKVQPIEALTSIFTDLNFLDMVFRLFASSFLIAVQIALPMILVLLLIDVALGILTRAVPQLNVFVVGFPLKILVYMGILFMFFSTILYLFKQLMEQYGQLIQTFYQLLGGTA